MSTRPPASAMKTSELSLASLVLCAFAAVSVGCAGSEGKDAAPTEEGAKKSLEPKPVDGPQKVASVDGAPGDGGDEYEVKISPAEAKVGEAAKVTIEVLPADGWHLNMEFPTALTVEAPADVSLAKAEYGKADAVEFGEGRGEFAVGYTASAAGDKAFSGELKFAICQDTGCAPRTERLAFNVPVE